MEWNSAKTAANIKKYSVSFEEAQSVFYDEFVIVERFLLLGMSTGARLLLVCHCEREAGTRAFIGLLIGR